MSIFTHLYSLLFLVALAAAIWPAPVSYSSGNDTLWIDQNVQIIMNGISSVGILTSQQSFAANLRPHADDIDAQNYGGPNTTDHAGFGSLIVSFAVQKTLTTLFQQNFVPWKFHPRNSDFEPSTSGKSFVTNITLTLAGADPASIVKPAAGEIDESYTLELPSSGAAQITAKSSIGLARGLTTFTQLFYQHSEGGVYTPYAPVSITDSPAFVHRGINMDVARNYFPVCTIKKMIDAAAYNKMNRFHLHITDGQSWPLVIPALPELSAKGAYHKDMVYTPDDVRELQRYGALQGVEVYLETDMPGHTSSIAYSHPELIAAFNVQPGWDKVSLEPPSGTLKLNSSDVNTFLNTMFEDLLPRLSTYTTYYHTGGDEVSVNAYALDETVKSNDSAVLQPLMQKFIDRNHEQVRGHGFVPIVWEEMLLTWNLTLGPDVVVQAWSTPNAIEQIVNAGHKVLAGINDYWYLDCGRGAWINYQPGDSSAAGAKTAYADYCSPSKNWRWMYSYDPLDQIPADKQHLVIGGETHIWAEMTDAVNIDRMVWPRAAAAAEILWSGAKDANGQNRSQVEAAPRLSEMRERLVARGVMAEPIQMPFCLMERHQCSL